MNLLAADVDATHVTGAAIARFGTPGDHARPEGTTDRHDSWERQPVEHEYAPLNGGTGKCNWE